MSLITDHTTDDHPCKNNKQESLANAKGSARQPWHSTQLNKSAPT